MGLFPVLMDSGCQAPACRWVVVDELSQFWARQKGKTSYFFDVGMCYIVAINSLKHVTT